MRAVLTRVKYASVTIDGEVTGKIGPGFLILLGPGGYGGMRQGSGGKGFEPPDF